MAKETTVEVEDQQETVTIDITDHPELGDVQGVVAEKEGEGEQAVVLPKKEVIPRVRLQEGTAADEATESLKTALTAAQTDRAAAEATALAERRRADENAARATAREAELKEAREGQDDARLALLTTSIETTTGALATLQADLTRAMEAGEFAKVSEVQVKISRTAAALDRLEDQKANYTPSRKTTTGAVEAPVQQNTASPFEQYVSTFAPQAQAWLRAHPECAPITVGGDAVANAKMMKGHYAALEQRIEPNTAEYFRVIEEQTGHRAPVSAAATTVKAGEEGEVQRQAPAVRKTAPAPSAPVTRDPPNGANRTTRSVTLSRDQQDAAKVSFPHLPQAQAFAQYARNLLELESEGKMGRLTH